MAPPVVGKRYNVTDRRMGAFVGRCVWAEGQYWEFELESFVGEANSNYGIGDTMAVRVEFVSELEEIPLDAKG